jgi:glycosyltransferase involved in cell wall biosynthesis
MEYDHEYLPYSRKEFPQHPLFVTRSVLLALHYRTVKIPRIKRTRDLVLDLVRGSKPPHISDERYERTLKTLQQADFINVSTTKDLPVLKEKGIDPAKVAVFPYGLSEDLISAYEKLSSDLPSIPCIAFVGTFDERKGGADLPRIFNKVARAIPGARMRLLGTAGLFQTTDEVRNLFPLHLRRQLEVYPKYVTEALPGLLEDCSAGVFPSYLEGFGFAVLEMLAAGLPVAAYDVPGPCDIVTEDYLAESGNWERLADRLVSLLKNPEKLKEERQKARERAKLFRWKQIAADTDRVYREAVRKHRAKV